jgi:hypothetical protein
MPIFSPKKGAKKNVTTNNKSQKKKTHKSITSKLVENQPKGTTQK